MKYRKRKFLVAAAVAALFVGCSSDSHSPSKPNETSAKSSSSVSIEEILGISSVAEPGVSSSSVKESNDIDSDVVKPIESTLTRSACDSKMDSKELKALDVTNAKAFEMFRALNNGDIDDIKDLSAEVKPMYASILKTYPNSCGAQLGYAIASLFDLTNNKAINQYVETVFDVNSQTDFYSGEVRMAKFLNEFSSKVGENISVHTQNIIATQILPTLDTSITYMQNILAQDDYILQFEVDGKKRELDRSEFGPGIGIMFAAKAAFTMLCSMNLNFDNNGSYDWIVDIDEVTLTDQGKHDSKQTAAIKFLNSLIGQKGAFSSVNKGWESQWKSIPDMLDSALRNVRAGFKYSINESYDEGSQIYDIYVVGDGADADVSVKDLQNAVSAIDVALSEVLEGPYLLDLNDLGDVDFSITIDIRKFFANTKGYEPFLPYYVLKDPSDFGTFYFTDESGRETASLRDLQYVSFTKETVYNKLYFPDPSFGGVFPKLKTQQDVWDLLIELDHL